MIEATDSYIREIRLRMQSINPNRVIKGPMDTSDWPPKEIVFEALYLLTLNDISGNGSQEVPIYAHQVQWVWVILGADIGDGKRGRNRGNRYRVDYAIKDELRRASSPNLTEKVRLSESNGQLVATPFNPPQFITWSRLDFGPKRSDQNSGVVYGLASTNITQITDPISA